MRLRLLFSILITAPLFCMAQNHTGYKHTIFKNIFYGGCCVDMLDRIAMDSIQREILLDAIRGTTGVNFEQKCLETLKNEIEWQERLNNSVAQITDTLLLKDSVRVDSLKSTLLNQWGYCKTPKGDPVVIVSFIALQGNTGITLEDVEAAYSQRTNKIPALDTAMIYFRAREGDELSFKILQGQWTRKINNIIDISRQNNQQMGVNFVEYKYIEELFFQIHFVARPEGFDHLKELGKYDIYTFFFSYDILSHIREALMINLCDFYSQKCLPAIQEPCYLAYRKKHSFMHWLALLSFRTQEELKACSGNTFSTDKQ